MLRVPLVCIRSYLKLLLRYELQILRAYHPDVSIYVSKDVRILGYFSKPKGVREQRGLENAAVEYWWCAAYSWSIPLPSIALLFHPSLNTRLSPTYSDIYRISY